MNIPARYCTGYLGDIGVPPDESPMDFSAWFEAYLGGRWYTFDARHNKPRIGRILMARGRDATDVAIVTRDGSAQLSRTSRPVAARPALVRCEVNARSFSARAANRCITKGSVSAPNSLTMNFARIRKTPCQQPLRRVQHSTSKAIMLSAG
jgi:hypothetical protein